MNTLEFIKKEFSGWGKWERILFPIGILIIIIVSFVMKDSKVALVSAVCGISYSILAGKGKISCYLFGLSGTFCYSYISFKNALYGNLALYVLYYFPMQVLGIFKWKKHVEKNDKRINYFSFTTTRICCIYFTKIKWEGFSSDKQPQNRYFNDNI